jgi:hypothetical protein
MKFENMMMRGLFFATVLACGLALLAMIHPMPQGQKLAGTTPVATLLTATPAACPLPADGVLCPLQPAS